MGTATIPKLIINSPYEEPAQHWNYDPKTRTFSLVEGRRPAGYVTATPGAGSFDDPGIFTPLPLVNQIRPRVAAWREKGYAGASGVTKALLEHWRDPEQRDSSRRLFFCQLEAIEILIWLTESPAADRQGIEIPSDGGPFTRLCAKMATGAGKTIAMAMLIAWQVLNKTTYPQDRRFSKHIFVLAPGLTVKNRLQVLELNAKPGNFYDEFTLVPTGMLDRLRQGKILIRNWHTLMPDDPDAGPRVVKKGPESDEAFTRRVLGDIANAQNILVINDEAHHAWRAAPKSTIKGVRKEDIEQATRWIEGLDRIHKTRGIQTCFDFSATPFAPTGKASGEETLFGWIVSDFGLNDAIESGLVKTPQVVVRDDGQLTKEQKSRLYHIYMVPDVKDDLNRNAEEQVPLHDLVNNAYVLLGKDWLETAAKWKDAGRDVPPVMITVANRTETAARVKYAFTHKRIQIDELAEPGGILHIDSKVLEKAEAREEAPEGDDPSLENGNNSNDEESPRKKLSKKDQAELLRLQVDTVGQEGKPGEKIQNVISVGMLSEGWDARTVTHIMGLRAFTSQLLCEQVVGRGLRRTSYEIQADGEFKGLFKPEYVNIFGVPFRFLPHEGGVETVPTPPEPPIPVFADPNRKEYEISWPNIIRIDHEYRTRLDLTLSDVPVLELDALDTATLAEMAPVVEGRPDVTQLTEINLRELAQKRGRWQTIIFRTAQEVYDQMEPTWTGNKEILLAQVVGLVEQFIGSDRIVITPPLFNQDDVRRRIMLMLNMTKVVQHIWQSIRPGNTRALVPQFDREHPIRSTGDMRPWGTRKPCEITKLSHINLCVFDSTWEASEAFELDRNQAVAAWAKNDHLGFEILYTYQGTVRKYRPDFLIRLRNGAMLVLEVKGQDSQENQTKREFLDEWVEAVNGHGGFGRWACDVSRHPMDIPGILEKHDRVM
ncbi:MAG TPA: DEAD/DEAH box helicase family protein [Terriglobia bacterium]|nr:DEAD/DEAH box helicase family protein [Terriglobia bacterium]